MRDVFCEVTEEREDTLYLETDKCEDFFNNETGEQLIKLLHTNIRSIRKNYNEFVVFLQSLNKYAFDVIILSETWGFEPYGHSVKGYTTYFNGSNLNRSDGLIIYVREGLSLAISHEKVNNFVFSKLKLKINSLSFKIVCTYRSPSTHAVDFIGALHTSLTCENEDLCIFTGDINIDILSEDDMVSVEYNTLLSSLGFKSYINKPTRVTDIGGTCLDHIFVRAKPLALKNIVLTPIIITTNITDHYTPMLTITNSKNTPREPERLTENTKIDFSKLKLLLMNERWEDVLLINDVELCTDHLYRILYNNIEQAKTIVSTSNKMRKIKPWITYGLITSIHKRDKLKRKLLRNKDDEALRAEFKIYRNTLNNLLKTTKELFYKKKLAEADKNIGKIWRVINEVSGNIQNANHLSATNIFNDSIELKNNKDKADCFNNYFTNICDSIAPELLNADIQNKIPPSVNSLYLVPTNDIEIASHIATLKTKSSAGPDGISSALIKSIQQVVACPLTHIINLTMCTGIIPNAFKTSIITPLYKSGDTTNIKNYRPISLINHFAKIFENCIKITKFLESHNILSDGQFRLA